MLFLVMIYKGQVFDRRLYAHHIVC